MSKPLENQEGWIERFEPIGTNCEFGFVLRNLGSRTSRLFRWASLSPGSLIWLLRERFSGFFELGNLIPNGPGGGQDTIVETKFGCVLHSAMRSNGDASFIIDDPRIGKLYRIEKAKIDKQISDFASRLASGSSICVLTARQIGAEMASDLQNAIDSYAGNSKNALLIVSECSTEKDRIGTVEVVRPRLLHGWLSHFAPDTAAYQAEFDEWRVILQQAIRLLPTEHD